MMKPLEKAHLRALRPLTMLRDMEELEAAKKVVIMNCPTVTISDESLLNLLSMSLSLAVSQVEVVAPEFMRVTSSHSVMILVPQFAILF